MSHPLPSLSSVFASETPNADPQLLNGGPVLPPAQLPSPPKQSTAGSKRANQAQKEQQKRVERFRQHLEACAVVDLEHPLPLVHPSYCYGDGHSGCSEVDWKSTKLVVLSGAAYAGKTTAAQTIIRDSIRRYASGDSDGDSEDVRCATIYFQPSSEDPSSAMCRTIAHQWARLEDAWYADLATRDHPNFDELDSTLEQQFPVYIANPFRTNLDNRHNCIYLVFIDGLEHCHNPSTQIRIMELILDHIQKYDESPLRWLITSCSDGKVESGSPRAHPTTDTLNDAHSILLSGFQHIFPSGYDEQYLRSILEKVSNHPIWAKQIIAFIERASQKNSLGGAEEARKRLKHVISYLQKHSEFSLLDILVRWYTQSAKGNEAIERHIILKEPEIPTGVHGFIQSSFEEIFGRYDRKHLELITAIFGKNFMSASAIIAFLRGSDLRRVEANRQQEEYLLRKRRLEDVVQYLTEQPRLSTASNNPLALVYGLYSFLLDQVIRLSKTATSNKKALYENAKWIMGFYLLPFGFGSWTRSQTPLSFLAGILDIGLQDAISSLDPFRSLLDIPEGTDAYIHPLRFLHASFTDYLRDSTTDASIRIDARDVELHLWVCHFRQLKKFNTISLKQPSAESENDPESKVLGLKKTLGPVFEETFLDSARRVFLPTRSSPVAQATVYRNFDKLNPEQEEVLTSVFKQVDFRDLLSKYTHPDALASLAGFLQALWDETSPLHQIFANAGLLSQQQLELSSHPLNNISRKKVSFDIEDSDVHTIIFYKSDKNGLVTTLLRPVLSWFTNTATRNVVVVGSPNAGQCAMWFDEPKKAYHVQPLLHGAPN
ncbi:hypothetical protein AN958_00293 [Leucoagaricus sp. SymC.cos]|nr:hypothetical protein AN958_00293 [Leucoagaricus sp. SymC.cos]